jgi:hypothetical protein
MKTMTKATVRRIGRKRNRKVSAAKIALPDAEVLPAEDTYERAVAAVKTERSSEMRTIF